MLASVSKISTKTSDGQLNEVSSSTSSSSAAAATTRDPSSSLTRAELAFQKMQEKRVRNAVFIFYVCLSKND